MNNYTKALLQGLIEGRVLQRNLNQTWHDVSNPFEALSEVFHGLLRLKPETLRTKVEEYPKPLESLEGLVEVCTVSFLNSTGIAYLSAGGKKAPILLIQGLLHATPEAAKQHHDALVRACSHD